MFNFYSYEKKQKEEKEEFDRKRKQECQYYKRKSKIIIFKKELLTKLNENYDWRIQNFIFDVSKIN
jgi:hypothetical protein